MKSHKPKTAAQRVAAQVEKRNTLERLSCADTARRSKLEADPAEWLRYYLSWTYTRPFEKPHLEIIGGTIRAHETDGRFVVAAERGIGKSAILWGMVLYFALTGKRRFPVCVPWADKALKRAFRFWKNALCFNARLLADYPEFCQPFAHAKGISQRVPNVQWTDGKLAGAQLTVGEGIIVLPDGRGCIGGATINGNIRGLNHPQEDGTLLRPDIVLLDDVQDRQVAKSAVQVVETVAVIDGDVAGCGDAGRDLPMLMACNCIVRGDVAEHYLTQAEWKALRVPCIERWPDGWEDLTGAARKAWDDWNAVRKDGGDDLAFYADNRAAMTTGMVLSAPAAFSRSDKTPDAFYGVIRMYFRMGRAAFMAERQQEPEEEADTTGIYTLTPAIVQSRADSKRRIHELPEWAVGTVSSTDINPSYGLSSVQVALGIDQTAVVPWYNLQACAIRDDIPEVARNAAIFSELKRLGAVLAGLPNRPAAWAIDAGGKQFDAVTRFIESAPALCGIRAYAFTGRGWKNYRQSGKTAVGPFREMAHGCLDMKQGRRIRWVAWQSDYWKEISQRAWLGEIGTPGSLSIWGGAHPEFSAQVSNEVLVGKAQIGPDMAWNWHRRIGKNDFGDALAQAYALAAYEGIGTGGKIKRNRKIAAVVGGRRVGSEGDNANGTHGEWQNTGAAYGNGNIGSERDGGGGSGSAGGSDRPKRRAIIGRRGW